ncbi:MAG: S8 family serine peptidase [Deltaproteobacteria bacterium]|nr:S8 family serine peptidase [Deltaproteobacteria bacterium]
MTVSSRALVDLVLLGPTNDRRQLQDSPILGDVWIAFAARPIAAMDLLITPYKARPAGPVAVLITEQIRKLNLPRAKDQEAQVAYLQGLVAARLFFREVLRVVVPMTQWWRDRKVEEILQTYAPQTLTPTIQAIINWAKAGTEDRQDEIATALAGFTSLDRYVALAGIILWAGGQEEKAKAKAAGGGVGGQLAKIKGPDPIVKVLQQLFKEMLADTFPREAQIWQVSLNRKALPALEKSVPAVKGDAARTLFKVRCDEIRWAVLDSGMDGGHKAFMDKEGNSRIIKAFDFSNIRRILSLDNLYMETAELSQWLAELRKNLARDLREEEAIKTIRNLAEDADNDRPIDWQQVEKFIIIDPKTPPRSGHGTHVAGIIGANGESAGHAPGVTCADGMCPDIKFFDFRILAKTLEDTEFAIIAALQYIRYLNERHNFISIHGVNLSISIPHDVRNFACGRTPICNECERLVESGVVVVAAAGNLGYQRFETKDGSYEGYTAFSITDPGNADGVITVGATHRFRPHTYGVSFFSSRGPTGDGRLKPDLVAPGERIESCLPGQEWGELDGTSMAAPHVSGAAAMLMARYAEFVGEPRRIKRILCESATDLGRERSFQGHGMLDVLRAFQSI